MIYSLRRYITHRFTATNHHGVHSPFVFDYVTKCLYTKPNYSGSVIENIVLKSVAYFAIDRFYTPAENGTMQNRIQRVLDVKVSEEPPFDLIYLNAPMPNVVHTYAHTVHNDSLIVLANIHRSAQASSIWKKVSADKRVTVSIDLFHCGILFLRKEQEKQHFKIRI